MDLSLIGDIYTKGSWNLKLILITRENTYRNVDLSYSRLKSGNKLLGDNTDRRDFYSLETSTRSKANLNRRFSANINAGSSSYQQNNSYSDKDYLSNTFQSNLSYSKLEICEYVSES